MTYNGSVTLPSDATVVYVAIKFIWETKRETKSSNSNEGHKEELNEVSYNEDEDEDQLEEEQDLKESLEVFPTTMNDCLEKRLLNI